ncbi:HEAT repeat-containing protein 1 isoform X2 [Ciona intestinalis]
MKTNPISSLMVHLTKHAEELTSDPEYILQCFANYFNEKNKPTIKKSRHALLKTLVQNMVNGSSVSKLGVAFMTRCINKVEPFHFDPLLPLVTTFVDQSNVRTLDDHEALLTTEWLKKLTPESLNETSKQELFFKVLTFQKEDKSSYLPQNVVFDLITKSFYTSLSDEIKQQLISTLLNIGQSTINPDVAKMVFKVFKVIPLRSIYLIKELKKSFPSTDTKSTLPSGVIAAKRARLSKSTSSESGVPETETPTWKRMIVLLEVLQHKKKIIKPKLLVAHLFTALNWMIDLQTGNDVIDYGTQLVLGALHNVFMIAKSKLGAKDDTDIRNSLRVELLVKCIQTSGNTQTCQHAVVLLAEAASICPEKLLHSVMSIFTFMGSNLLRRDDSYSFQIITKTIHTVVPALLQHMESATSGINKNTVTDIIRVFVDALPHIPPHRRLVVFEELINTLGGNEYLWQTLLLLVASRANKITKTAQEDEQDILSGSEEDVFLPSTVDALMEVCSSVSNLFPDHLQLESMVRMLNFISLLPDENDPKQKIDPNLPNLIDVPKQSTSHLRRLHLAVVSFASHLLSLEGGISNSFKLEKSTEHDAAENATKMLTKFQSLLETSLSYLSQTTTAVLNTHDDMTSRYYRTLQNRLNSLLDKINNLLPSDTFMLVVSSILHEQSSNTTVQKVIELFNDRVAHTKHILTPDQENVLLYISRQLIVLCGDHGTNNHGMRAVAYTGLRHVARMCGIGCATHLISILPMICDITKEKQLPIQVISSAMLCLGEIFSTFKAHCISHLPSIAPCLVMLLHQSKSEKSYHMTACILSAYQKLVDTLPHFISPYLVGFISELISASPAALEDHPEVDPDAGEPSRKKRRQKMNIGVHFTPDHMATKISSVLKAIAGKVPARVLVPMFTKCYEKINAEEWHSVRVLLRMVAHHVAVLTKHDLSHFALPLFDFYLETLEYRDNMTMVDKDEVDAVEEVSVDGTICLLLKLPEATFKPLFVKLNHWGCSDDATPTRTTTFYHCTCVMAGKLKSLFSLFAGPLLSHMMESLKHEEIDPENVTRCRYVVETFKLTLLHSSSNFMNQQRFDMTAGVLVDQLEKFQLDNEMLQDYIINYIIPCIGQLVMSSRNDVAWQPLNYQILLKMRHKNPEVRLHALETLLVVAEKLGDDYMVLLPETIPFLAELMEDENDNVEKRCHAVIKRMEEVLGEPLQKYF